MKLDTIFENEDFIAINKPSGLLSIPDRFGKDPSVKSILQDQLGKIFTVHRLDKDTSGLIVFAKNEETHKDLSQKFEGRDVEKFYLGLVTGILMNKSGTIDVAIMEHPGKTTLMMTNRKENLHLQIIKCLKNLEFIHGYNFKFIPAALIKYAFT